MNLEQEGTEQIESGATESPSPEATSSESTPAPQQNVATAEHKPDTQTPFHEHPRWKEVVEQKNQALKETRQLQSQMAEMQKRFESMSKPAKQADPMIERLKGVDPEFASYMEQIAGSKQDIQALREWQQRVETDRVRTEAVNSVNRLHEQNKVPENLRELYNTQLEQLVSKNPQARLEDIPVLFKQVHDQYSKIIDDIKRSERESYVKSKTKDAGLPASPKGKAVTPSGKFEWSKNPDEAKAQMIQRIVKMSKASNDV